MMANIGMSSMRKSTAIDADSRARFLKAIIGMIFSGCSPHKDSEGPCNDVRLTPTAYVIGWGGRSFKPRFLSLFFFYRKLGLERWLPPRAFVLGVALSALLSRPVASCPYVVFVVLVCF